MKSLSYFEPVQVGDNFDPVAAKAAGDQPERLAAVPSTVSLPESSTSSDSLPSIATSTNSVITVPAGGGQQNSDQPNASGPSTVSLLTVSSTLSSSPLSTTAGGGQTDKSPPNVGAIIGIVIGSLAFLVMVGFGALVLRKQKSLGKRIGRDNLGHPSDVATHGNDTELPEMRLYVSFFFSFSCLTCFLTNVDHIGPG